MNVTTINSFICAGLFWLVLLVVIFHGSDLIYENPPPLKPSYDITGGEQAVVAPLAEKSQITLANRLHEASLENGRKVFGQCALCHTPLKDGPNRVGPHLWGVVNRPFASLTDFTYSRAMRAQNNKIWNFATLDAYLKSPRKTVPGTAMSFAGIRDDQYRADLLLYLRSLAETPAELPTLNDKP